MFEGLRGTEKLNLLQNRDLVHISGVGSPMEYHTD